MEEETLNSFAFRTLLVSGEFHIDSECEAFFDSAVTCELFPRPGFRREAIFDKLLSRYGVDYLIEQHTLLPLYRPIAKPCAKPVLNNLLTFRGRREYALNACFNSQEITRTGLRYCPCCFEEQVAQFGFCWFKRVWSIYSMRSCTKHKCRLLLVSRCCTYDTTVDYIRSALQGVCSTCGRSIWEVKPDENDDHFSRWLCELLEAKLPTLSQKLVYGLLKLCATSIHNSQPDLSEDALIDFLVESHSCTLKKVTKSSDCFYRGKSCPKRRFRYALYTTRYGTYPLAGEYFHTVSLAFPKFDDFKKYLYSISIPFPIQVSFGSHMYVIDQSYAIETRALRRWTQHSIIEGSPKSLLLHDESVRKFFDKPKCTNAYYGGRWNRLTLSASAPDPVYRRY